MTKLSLANLPQIGAKLRIPNYKRSDLKAGILHFGLGNFHRAHLAVYLDDLFNKGLNHDWALIGAGVMSFDEKVRQTLASQDYLTTVVEQDNDLSTAHVTGALIDFIPPGDKPALLAKLADPAIRIVSMTITEGARPLDDLRAALVNRFAGQIVTMSEIYERHNVGTPYIKANYKEALSVLEAEGKIKAEPPAEAAKGMKKRPKGTFGPKVMVTFPQRGKS